MRSPAERRLAYQVELARGRRLAAGIPADETWSKRLRQRWPMRLMCSMECGPGWADLVEALNELIDVEATGEFRFTQIKEKFGQLRAYWHGVDEHGRIEELVEAAEEVSASMCETCGGDAKVWQTQGGPGFGYVHVACDEHARPGSASSIRRFSLTSSGPRSGPRSMRSRPAKQVGLRSRRTPRPK